MELTKIDKKDINRVLEDCGCYENAIEVSVFKDDKELYYTPQIFETKEDLVNALENLDNYKFQSALNRHILFNKIDNLNSTYSLQCKSYEIEFSTELDVE